MNTTTPTAPYEKVTIRVVLISPRRKTTKRVRVTMSVGTSDLELLDFLIQTFSKRWLIDLDSFEFLSEANQ